MAKEKKKMRIVPLLQTFHHLMQPASRYRGVSWGKSDCEWSQMAWGSGDRYVHLKEQQAVNNNILYDHLHWKMTDSDTNGKWVPLFLSFLVLLNCQATETTHITFSLVCS